MVQVLDTVTTIKSFMPVISFLFICDLYRQALYRLVPQPGGRNHIEHENEIENGVSLSDVILS